jgi:predicted nucleic acid-binding protein
MVTFDTNIAVYAFSDIDPKSSVATDVMLKANFVSVQLLSEFANVMHKKRNLDFERINFMREQIVDLVDAILPVDEEINKEGMRIAERYGLSVYDALMIAVALKGGATTFYSEDMQHGLVVDSVLTIVDPFKQENS